MANHTRYERASLGLPPTNIRVPMGDPAFNPPDTPNDLLEAERELWTLTVELMREANLPLEKCDGELLRQYVSLKVRYQELWDAHRQEPTVIKGSRGDEKKHPAEQVLRDYLASIMSVSDRLGLNPKARVSIPRTREVDYPDDLD
jgi:P27 family predicted phage terminase small subunit